MRLNVSMKELFPVPVSRVWHALTDPQVINRWLMATNDFEAKVGARVTLRDEPRPGFRRYVECQVLELRMGGMDAGPGTNPGALGFYISTWVVMMAAMMLPCLTRCRNPRDYLLERWHDGRDGALHMGIEHGAWCLGCCWARDMQMSNP
jgi:hypothetical protein